MVEDAAGLDYIDNVSKRAEEIIFHAEWEKSVLKSVSNRMNSWYSRNWKSLDAYLYSVSKSFCLLIKYIFYMLDLNWLMSLGINF